MMNVLVNIVDDDADSAGHIVYLLKKHGIENCKIFTDPEAFLKSQKEVHICVLDYRFTNSPIDGLEITEELIRRNKRCRVIVVTVAPDFKKFMKIYNAGAWKYLDKGDENFEHDIVKYVRIGIEIIAEERDLLLHIKKRYKIKE